MFSYGRMEENARNVFQKCPCHKLAGHGLKILLLIALIVIIGLSIAISLQKSGSKVEDKPFNSSLTRQYLISQSCPSLESEYLLSQVGSSFEGFRQTLTCKSGHKPFPDVIKCVKRGPSLTWSHLPVCYPEHTLIHHFKEVVCRGNQTITSCQMLCLNKYVPIDSKPYFCTSSPCPKVELEKNEAVCYICNEKCKELRELEPQLVNEGLLKLLNCSSKCSNIIISSKGISSHRNFIINGLYNLVGEHKGHLLYKNKASLYYLYYYNSKTWAVGANFKDDAATFKGTSESNVIQCPEDLNDADKHVVDFISQDFNGWISDPNITFKCFEGDHKRAFSCPCLSYNFNYSLENFSGVPPESEYILGDYMLSNDEEKEYQVQSQIYKHPIKQQFLLSNDGHFRVWRIQHKNGNILAIGYTDEHDDGPQLCPDNVGLTWEWYKTTTPEGKNNFVDGPNLRVECLQKM